MQLTAPMSPALRFVESNQWLLTQDARDKTILDLKATGPDTVELTVHSPWIDKDDPDQHEYWVEESHLIADHAAGLLEPVIDGVKLLVKSSDGYVGEPTYVPSPDEQYFATSIPGVMSQFYMRPWDVDGDGTIGDDEQAWEFEVGSKEDAERIDKLIVDNYTWDGPQSPEREPVIYTVVGDR